MISLSLSLQYFHLCALRRLTVLGARRVVEPSECSICLEEFEAGVDVRQLGRCGHVFHLICIDKWLDGQATCPMCRGTVLDF
ncbi:unnamed protein product [Linum tenue]|uniref:RING-type domain-containing protein n=1 Tax=Linum tenue TaxID=586396 RepID=A0AAV0L555_9ROSI|nr:unnamed protein product [Linum tenue]